MKVPKVIQPHRLALDIQRWSEGLWNIESRGMFVLTLIPLPAHLSSALQSQAAHIKVQTWLILGGEIYPRLDSPRCILFITVGCYYSPCLVLFINLFICRVQCIHADRVGTLKSLLLSQFPDKQRWKSENGGRWFFFCKPWREKDFWLTERHRCCCAQVLPPKKISPHEYRWVECQFLLNQATKFSDRWHGCNLNCDRRNSSGVNVAKVKDAPFLFHAHERKSI